MFKLNGWTKGWTDSPSPGYCYPYHQCKGDSFSQLSYPESCPNCEYLMTQERANELFIDKADNVQ